MNATKRQHGNRLRDSGAIESDMRAGDTEAPRELQERIRMVRETRENLPPSAGPVLSTPPSPRADPLGMRGLGPVAVLPP